MLMLLVEMICCLSLSPLFFRLLCSTHTRTEDKGGDAEFKRLGKRGRQDMDGEEERYRLFF